DTREDVRYPEAHLAAAQTERYAGVRVIGVVVGLNVLGVGEVVPVQQSAADVEGQRLRGRPVSRGVAQVEEWHDADERRSFRILVRVEHVRVVAGLHTDSAVQEHAVRDLDPGVALAARLVREALVADRHVFLREGNSTREQRAQSDRQSKTTVHRRVSLSRRRRVTGAGGARDGQLIGLASGGRVMSMKGLPGWVGSYCGMFGSTSTSTRVAPTKLRSSPMQFSASAPRTVTFWFTMVRRVNSCVSSPSSLRAMLSCMVAIDCSAMFTLTRAWTSLSVTQLSRMMSFSRLAWSCRVWMRLRTSPIPLKYSFAWLVISAGVSTGRCLTERSTEPPGAL